VSPEFQKRGGAGATAGYRSCPVLPGTPLSPNFAHTATPILPGRQKRRPTSRSSFTNTILRIARFPPNSSDPGIAALSEATIDNRIVGFQSVAGAPIPALPLAILREAQEGDARESWLTQIEDRQGADHYGYDEQTGLVTDGPDGIPEIRLRSAIRRGDPKNANAHLFDVNGCSTDEELLLHMQNGWRDEDLPKSLTKLRFDENSSHEFETVGGIHGAAPHVLKELLGQCRILFLYDDFLPTGRSGAGRIQVTQAVAGRVLSIEVLDDDGCELIIQPGVMTTRTALLASSDNESKSGRRKKHDPEDRSEKLANRYIYKLQITN
jgi:hypothetical protein